MSQNNINELRSILFETLRGVQSGSIDPDRAKSVCDTAQVIINTAKVEIDHGRVFGAVHTQSNFIPVIRSEESHGSVKISTGTVTRNGNVLTHKMG